MNKQKLSTKITLAAIGVVGLLLIIGGYYGVAYLNQVEKNFVPVTAKIETIKERTEYHRGKRRVHHDVWVRFPAKNTTYKTSLSVYTPFMEVGDDIAIMYDPRNPNEVHSLSIEKIFAWTFFIAGISFLLVDWFVLRKILKDKALIK